MTFCVFLDDGYMLTPERVGIVCVCVCVFVCVCIQGVPGGM
jgi:hypothetical protein